MLMCPSAVGKTARGDARGVVVPCLGRHLLRDQPPRRLEVQHLDLRLQQRGVHPLPLPRPFPFEQRQQDALRQQHPRRQVRDRDPHPHRPLPRQSRNRHQPAQPLRNLVHPRTIPVRPVLPEPADAPVHDSRVHLAHRFVIDPEPVLHPRPVVLDDDVRILRELHEDVAPRLRLQVQRQAALVAVQVLEVEPVPLARDSVPAAWSRRQLDLGHVRAPVRELTGARWPRPCPRQVERADPLER